MKKKYTINAKTTKSSSSATTSKSANSLSKSKSRLKAQAGMGSFRPPTITPEEEQAERLRLLLDDALNGRNNVSQSNSLDASVLGTPQSTQDSFDRLPLSMSGQKLVNTGARDFSPGFKLFNTAAQLTTGIANRIADFRNDRRNQLQYLKSIQGTPQPNYDEDGFNKALAYYKAGGFNLNPAHKGDCTPMSKSTCTGKKRQFAINAKNHFKKQQTGGGVGQNAELEEGEIYQTPQGDINKIQEGAGTHEQGGVDVGNVERVLEDTSDKRKDAASKALKLQPDTVKALLDFKPKTSISHAKAHEKAIEFYNKKSNRITGQLVKNAESREENDHDFYALNSMKFNMNTLKQLPSEQDMFDTLFNHQEMIKAAFGIANDGKKAQYGLSDYQGAKTKKGRYTPTNRDVNKKEDYIPLTPQEISDWESVGVPVSKMSVADAQGAMYDYALKNDPQQVKQMWGTFGNTWKGRNEGILKDIAPNGDLSQVNLTNEQLQSLRNAYTDGMFAVRRLRPTSQANNTIPNMGTTQPQSTTTPIAPIGNNPASPTQSIQTTTQPNNRFNEPLKWFDVAGELMGLADDKEAPVRYNPAEFTKIRQRDYNPLPTLQQGQADYNSMVKSVASTGVDGGVQFGNVGNLYSRKYALNNQELGNAENINGQRKFQVDSYNANVDDRQSLSNQQARELFEQKVLGTKEAVRQQRRADWGSIFTKLAQNSALNKNGNLLMHLFPAFNQTGDYNGYQRQFHTPTNFPGGSSLDINAVLTNAGIDPNAVPAKDRARYAIQIAKKINFPTKR